MTTKTSRKKSTWLVDAPGLTSSQHNLEFVEDVLYESIKKDAGKEE